MKKFKKRLVSVLLAAALIAGMLPALSPSGFAVEGPGVALGVPVLAEGLYTYANAVVTGHGLKTILISFTGSIAAGDLIRLPASPPGFTVSESSVGNNYAKRINLADGIEADAVQTYLRAVGYEVSGASQSLKVTVTTEDIQYDTYYSAHTQHYYQYVPLALDSETWITSYEAAQAMTYMGRTGYLATVTSLQEDAFIRDLSGNVGWLGGTRMAYIEASDTFNPVETPGYWYWADGPEKGNHFYDAQYVTEGNVAATDAANAAYYFNWNRPLGATNEPNSTAAGGESCLTTLHIGTGYAGTAGYSWNDRDVDANYLDSDSEYQPRGSVVEYGNQTTGDSGGGSLDYAYDSGTLYDTSDIALNTAVWQSADSYACGITLPTGAQMVTLSVDSGTFTVPSLGGALTFLGGTSGTYYVSAHHPDTTLNSAVFSFSNVALAESVLSDLLYTPNGTAPQTITATSCSLSPEAGDIFFDGHFYRYVDSGFKSISWLNAALSAGGTIDPYFGGRGYLATAVSQAENSILLRLVDTGLGGADHWDDAWMGGLWQRNTGTVAAAVTRGTDGNEITFAQLLAADEGQRTGLLQDYSITYTGDPICDGSSEYMYAHPETVRYYWIDGPEAGQELAANTGDFAPWHTSGGIQDEPNSGDFVYIGWQGAFWDDLSAYPGDNSAGGYDKLDGYIVEFSGFEGGSAEGIIKSAEKTVALTEISVVNVTGVTPPQAGDAPDLDAVCTAPGISDVSSVTWAPVVAADFASAQTYTASVTLTAGNGYQFSADPIGTVNGFAALVSRDDDTHVTVSYAFDPTASPYVYPPQPEGPERIPVLIDGVSYEIGTAVPETEAGTGIQTTVVTVDEDEFNAQLAHASDSVIIPVPELEGSTAQRSILTAAMVDGAAQRDMSLEVLFGDVRYVMRADAIPVAELANTLQAAEDEWGSLLIQLSISACAEPQLRAVETADGLEAWTLMLPPVAFTVTAELNGRSVQLDTFSRYVERVIALPEGADPVKITTALVVTGDGEEYHVPTEVYQDKNGYWFARVHSLTNSVYALVWNEAAFPDAQGQWYEDAVNEMASRMILRGREDGHFDGEASITRAEFAAVLVRALGLQENGTAGFADVAPDAWYAGAVGKAAEHKIVLGREGNRFDPAAEITREEAMAMLFRAAAVTELPDQESGVPEGYSDFWEVSGWASQSAAFNLRNGLILGFNGFIRPTDSITRGETAAAVLRLLQKSGLIDIRTEA